jgi:hypothetical protein
MRIEEAVQGEAQCICRTRRFTFVSLEHEGLRRLYKGSHCICRTRRFTFGSLGTRGIKEVV